MRDRPPYVESLAVALMLFTACTRASDDNLLPRLKSALAERDRKLTSYRFSAESHQGSEVARHTFAFRSPNKMRGELIEPKQLVLAFDGTTLAQALPRDHKLVHYQLKLPAAQASSYLHQTFAPFVFEGFRAPLLPPNQATAKQIDDTVEVSGTVNDGADPIVVRYRFKWPSADFISKSMTAADIESELKVDEEQCDAKLGLCVPARVSQRHHAAPVGDTKLTQIELNPELPAEGFALRAEDGWTTETEEVSDVP